jgi:hypothetical protein
MTTKFSSKRLLFDATPIAISEDVEEKGWIPGEWPVGRGRTRTVMAPIGHYGRDKRERVRHVVLVHACARLAELQQTA